MPNQFCYRDANDVAEFIQSEMGHKSHDLPESCDVDKTAATSKEWCWVKLSNLLQFGKAVSVCGMLHPKMGVLLRYERPHFV